MNRIALVDQGADQDAHLVMFKRQAPVSKEEPVADLKLDALPESMRQHFADTDLSQSVVDALAGALTTATETVPEATQTALEEANKSLEDARKALAEKEDENEEDDDKDLTKGMTPEVAKAFTDMRAENETLRKSHEAEVEKRETSEFVATAKNTFTNIPGADPEVVGPVLYRMSKNEMTDEDRKKVTEMFTAASNTNKLLTQELGTSAGEVSSAEDKIEQIAKGIRDTSPDLSPEQAYTKALDTPEGKAAYVESRRERASNGVLTD